MNGDKSFSTMTGQLRSWARTPLLI